MIEWAAIPTSGAALGGGADGDVPGDGVRLHYVTRGDGPLVVLLHGFPEFWFAWRHQLPALAAAGYRVVALDLRGYNLSDRPGRVEAYALDRLTADVAAAIEALGGQAHAVVGHDWGGAIAWRLARTYPHALSRLAILNAPHPRRLAEVMRHEPRQFARFWYMGAIQLPWLPERTLLANDAALVIRALRAEHARDDAIGEPESAAYRAAFRIPGAMHAALAYYRAAVRGPSRASRGGPIAHPTLVIWGDRDGALLPSNADGLARWVPNVRVHRIPWARHFVQSDAPDEVNRALVAFLRA